MTIDMDEARIQAQAEMLELLKAKGIDYKNEEAVFIKQFGKEQVIIIAVEDSDKRRIMVDILQGEDALEKIESVKESGRPNVIFGETSDDVLDVFAD